MHFKMVNLGPGLWLDGRVHALLGKPGLDPQHQTHKGKFMFTFPYLPPDLSAG